MKKMTGIYRLYLMGFKIEHTRMQYNRKEFCVVLQGVS